jgi:hypothetical protein
MKSMREGLLHGFLYLGYLRLSMHICGIQDDVLCLILLDYPQKRVLIHSYWAVFHTRSRQILAYRKRHPPYLGGQCPSARWVIHKRSRLSTVIKHFSTSYVMQMNRILEGAPHIYLP